MRTPFLAPLALTLAAQTPQEVPTTLKDQQALAVTIYNDNLALVKDQREVRLPKGMAALAFQEVSAQIRPETALLRNLTSSKDFWVAEQNFDFDLLTPAKLLEKYVGEQVTVVRTVPNADGAGAKEVRETATVLATNSGTVLQFADRIETSVPGRLIFPKVPDNLRARPTLVVSLHSPVEKPQKLELSYLTGGLSWRADYVINLAPDEKAMDLNGWVTLTNQSGTAYPNATLQLVAGDVNRAREAAMPEMAMMSRAKAMPAAPRMQEESLFEYHLYTLDRPTTLKESQTKQVALLSASSIPTRKEYLLQGQSHYYSDAYGDLGQRLKVGVFVEFDNRTEANLGLPMPKGIVRVYKRTASRPTSRSWAAPAATTTPSKAPSRWNSVTPRRKPSRSPCWSPCPATGSSSSRAIPPPRRPPARPASRSRFPPRARRRSPTGFASASEAPSHLNNLEPCGPLAFEDAP